MAEINERAREEYEARGPEKTTQVGLHLYRMKSGRRGGTIETPSNSLSKASRSFVVLLSPFFFFGYPKPSCSIELS